MSQLELIRAAAEKLRQGMKQGTRVPVLRLVKSEPLPDVVRLVLEQG